MTGTALERITNALHANGLKVRTNGATKAQAQCPAHDDGQPSLSLTGIEGSTLIYCHAGCHTDDVLAALNMTRTDLYDNPRGATYNYTDPLGGIIRTVHRTPDKQFRQSGDTKATPTLYRLPQVLQAVAAGRPIYLTEGEKDVHALEAVGQIATTAPMGAANIGKCDLSPLAGAHVVAVVDRDSAGDGWADTVHETLSGTAASLRFVHAATGKDAADHIAAGHPVNDFEPARDPGAEHAERVRRIFPRLDWSALWLDDTEEEWVHNPLLPARRLVTIYSPPKVGKSLLLLEMAVALSLGRRFLGFTPPSRQRVLYVDFENDPRGDIRSRLQAMGYGPNDLDHLDYLSFPTMAGLDTERGGTELVAAVKAYGAHVVMIDTVSRAVDGEENSNDTWLGLYRHTGLRLKQLGVAMIRLDHTGKDETRGTRGGSAKSGDVDVIWKLTKTAESRFRLECTDARLQVDTKTLHLVRNTVPRLHHTVDGRTAELQHDDRVKELAALCDANGLPADASRNDVQTFLKSRGHKMRTTVLADIVKHRKLFPSRGNSSTEQPVPADREQTEQTTLHNLNNPSNDADSPCSQPNGNKREQTSSAPVPVSVPHVVGTDGRDTEQDNSPAQVCAECNGPNTPDRAAGGLCCLDCYAHYREDESA